MRAAYAVDEKRAWAAYENGDMRSALDQFLKLAEAGKPYYLVVAARIIMDGEDMPIDLDKASDLLDMADSLGVRESLLQKAELYAQRGDQQNYFEYLKKASSKGVMAAKYYLGLCYINGRGTDLNLIEGMSLISSASAQGHLGARIFIARNMLLSPKGVCEFLNGVWMIVHAGMKSLVLAFSDPYDERLR